MASQEHVDIFLKGIDAWNAWRDENPDIEPDLSHAQLSGSNSSTIHQTKIGDGFKFKSEMEAGFLDAVLIGSKKGKEQL